MIMQLEDSPELKRLKSKMTVELLWLYILSILKKEDMHAYALRSAIQKRFGFLPGNVTAYVVLYKLQSRGFVKKKAIGNRVVYSITPNGKKLIKSAEKFILCTLKSLK
ncbi:MAG: PadR family transcriptional regulator [Candidatus Diapherotrites archaeon CG08_land_8_20_14_0_20_34_12]|nr:MAG: PadR family transcriptional regulator [Candidatus Diapherotrites archaeon CG08_land_8_20_14_0_20_34_12]